MKKVKKPKRKKRRAKRAGTAAPSPGSLARLPLPPKGEKRHGDRTKYARAREKERLRRDLER